MLRVRRAVLALMASVACAAALSACGSDDEPPAGPRYVALGDSAVAGAGIGVTAPPCYNSQRNYAALVADRLDVDDFVDASCIGATSQAIAAPQKTDTGETVPAQIEAVTPETDVVTISIGGNDRDYIPALFTACYSLQNDEEACRDAIGASEAKLGQIRGDVVAALQEITRQAPRAQVVMVTYLRIMPDSGTCEPDVVRIATPELTAAAEAEARLAATMAEAAEEAGAEVLDMRERSEGHDACAGDKAAWVSGATAKPGDGTFLHPRRKGAEAVATALAPMIEDRLTD